MWHSHVEACAEILKAFANEFKAMLNNPLTIAVAGGKPANFYSGDSTAGTLWNQVYDDIKVIKSDAEKETRGMTKRYLQEGSPPGYSQAYPYGGQPKWQATEGWSGSNSQWQEQPQGGASPWGEAANRAGIYKKDDTLYFGDSASVRFKSRTPLHGCLAKWAPSSYPEVRHKWCTSGGACYDADHERSEAEQANLEISTRLPGGLPEGCTVLYEGRWKLHLRDPSQDGGDTAAGSRGRGAGAPGRGRGARGGQKGGQKGGRGGKPSGGRTSRGGRAQGFGQQGW